MHAKFDIYVDNDYCLDIENERQLHPWLVMHLALFFWWRLWLWSVPDEGYDFGAYLMKVMTNRVMHSKFDIYVYIDYCLDIEYEWQLHPLTFDAPGVIFLPHKCSFLSCEAKLKAFHSF